MTTEVNESVQEQEVLDEVSSQPQAEEQQHIAEETEPTSKERNDSEYNWAEARRKMKRLESENRDMQAALEKVQDSPIREEKQAYDDGFEDDDILTAGQARKLASKIAEDIVRKREVSTVDERLELKHPDFQDVVSRDNINTLKETEPELALSLANISDPYKQGIAAYKLLKRFGIYQEDVSSPEKERAKKNSQKPVSVNSVTKNSAIGNAHLFENGLTPALKKQLFSEMQSARRQS